MGKRGPQRVNDARLYLVLRASLKAKLEQAAKANGVTVSRYVRHVVHTHMAATINKNVSGLLCAALSEAPKSVLSRKKWKLKKPVDDHGS